MQSQAAIVVAVWSVVALLLALPDGPAAEVPPLAQNHSTAALPEGVQPVVQLPPPPRTVNLVPPRSDPPVAFDVLIPATAAEPLQSDPLVPLAPQSAVAAKVVPMSPRPAMPEVQMAAQLASGPPPPATDRADAGPRMVTLDETTIASGRVLLRVLEQGDGPTIEIAWPDGAAARLHLFDRFRFCFGMQIALMDAEGALFGLQEPAGLPWRVDRDRYSTFVRDVGATATTAELELGRAIQSRHGGLSGLQLVRIFPRSMDAVLLGGIKRLAGHQYDSASEIHAVYELSRGKLLATSISLDGRLVPGAIDLNSVASC